jgi:transposase InsO family protein
LYGDVDKAAVAPCLSVTSTTGTAMVQIEPRVLREAFPDATALKYLIFDRGSNFNAEVLDTIKSFGITPNRTSFRSPWQNGIAERRNRQLST